MTDSRFLGRALWLGLFGLGFGLPSFVRAGEPCRFRIAPDRLPEPWTAAAHSATARLAALLEPHDCRTIDVAVRPDGKAVLTFSTKDGRQAIRNLGSSSELGPSIQALLVTLAPPPASSSASEPGSTEVPASALQPSRPAASARSAVAPSAAPVATPAPSVGFFLGASGASRVSLGTTRYLSPSLVLRPGLTLGAWEVGLVADASLVHKPLQTLAYDASLATFAMGLFLGRRGRLAGWQVGYGVSLAMESLQQTGSDLPGQNETRDLDLVVPRVGTYGRVAYPAGSRVRATFDLSGDALIGNLREPTAAKRHVPSLPRYGLGVGVGFEVSLL